MGTIKKVPLRLLFAGLGTFMIASPAVAQAEIQPEEYVHVIYQDDILTENDNKEEDKIEKFYSIEESDTSFLEKINIMFS